MLKYIILKYIYYVFFWGGTLVHIKSYIIICHGWCTYEYFLLSVKKNIKYNIPFFFKKHFDLI